MQHLRADFTPNRPAPGQVGLIWSQVSLPIEKSGQRPYIRRRCTPGGNISPYTIVNVMHIWAPLIPATRWSCSQPPDDSNDCRLLTAAPPGSWGTGCPDKHDRFSTECIVSLKGCTHRATEALR